MIIAKIGITLIVILCIEARFCQIQSHVQLGRSLAGIVRSSVCVGNFSITSKCSFNVTMLTNKSSYWSLKNVLATHFICCLCILLLYVFNSCAFVLPFNWRKKLNFYVLFLCFSAMRIHMHACYSQGSFMWLSYCIFLRPCRGSCAMH